MKKGKVILNAVLLGLLVTGCSSQSATNEQADDTGKKKEVVETDEQVKSGETDNKNAAEEKNTGVKDAQAEEKSDDAEGKNNEEQVQIEPQYKLNPSYWGFEPIADASEKVVLLTIDDAPDQHAVEMANKLKRLKVPAIFFINGHFIDTDEEKERLKQIHDMGFEIGNHTMTHASLRDLSEEKQREEIVTLNDIIEETIGERPKFFRAPFGQNTDYSKQLVAEENMLLMNWTYGYDWEKQYQNKEGISDIMVNTPLLSNGANLLMHDREWTNEGLEDIVKGLQEKGYGFIDPDTIQTPGNKK
ncbi:polysaccharide deacetylase family protein [Pseudalkalibacillus caeni]|uniref:Polysaccharide deacetylase family protein n=2 Tax=Exobacillus caeni TaxID=2574798 RepID=A0A5R9FEH9_9BACL|nr:polysaccharide deacetylase family protein [Pseudalkalibacillus caeni]